MTLPVTPNAEKARLAALRRYQVLEASRGEIFDPLIQLACEICETPISTITMIDAERGWTVAGQGLAAIPLPSLDDLFSAHTIRYTDPLVIEDLSADARFRENPLVAGAASLRFYAGVPLLTNDGYPIGTICVMDSQPRTISAYQLKCLKRLAVVTAKALETQVQALQGHEAEHEVAVSKAWLQFALDAAAIGDWDMDLRTNIARRSLRHDMCFGYSEPIEVWGYDTFLAHVHPDHRARVDACYQAALAGGANYDVEFQAVWPDQSIHWLWSKGTFYFDEDGKPYRVAGIQVDVTPRHEAEQRHLALEAQLLESQRLEAVGTLAGGVAHDFNNVLGIIQCNVCLALEDAAANPAVIESLLEIQKASHRGRDVVQQIMSFSRRQPTAKKRVRARDVLAEALRFLRSTVPSMIELSLDTPDTADDAIGPIDLMADVTQVEQLVINLVNNAVHALGGHVGAIQIVLNRVAFYAGGVNDADLKPGEYACISVRDTGSGMDAATRARIFEPFFTTKPTGEGTGLGLSVVHGILAAHGGAITVESTIGVGSTFKTYWPLAKDADKFDAPVAEANTTRHTAAKHILYLDDDQAFVSSFEKILSRRGFRVTGFSGVTEALRALEASPHGFDALVTDYNMPQVSGLQVAAKARSRDPGLPVIIISGFITDELRAAAEKLGVREVVSKPNSVVELCDALVTALAG